MSTTKILKSKQNSPVNQSETQDNVGSPINKLTNQERQQIIAGLIAMLGSGILIYQLMKLKNQKRLE